MKITIEVDSLQDVGFLEMSKINNIINRGVFELDPLNTGDKQWFFIDSIDRNFERNAWRDVVSCTIVLRSCSKPKSKELLSAENAVAKAKEALKAAEATLEVVSSSEEE